MIDYFFTCPTITDLQDAKPLALSNFT